jgi:hypothetical protein
VRVAIRRRRRLRGSWVGREVRGGGFREAFGFGEGVGVFGVGGVGWVVVGGAAGCD